VGVSRIPGYYQEPPPAAPCLGESVRIWSQASLIGACHELPYV